MKRRGKRVIEEPSINLTPLIDVVFVILIMFIVVAPLLEIERVELAPAAAASIQVQPLRTQSPVAIQVQADNSIWLRDKKVHPKDLKTELKKLNLQYAQITPQLYQDQRAKFGTYQIVKNAVEEAGWSELHLILQPGG